MGGWWLCFLKLVCTREIYHNPTLGRVGSNVNTIVSVQPSLARQPRKSCFSGEEAAENGGNRGRCAPIRSDFHPSHQNPSRRILFAKLMAHFRRSASSTIPFSSRLAFLSPPFRLRFAFVSPPRSYARLTTAKGRKRRRTIKWIIFGDSRKKTVSGRASVRLLADVDPLSL